MADSKPQAAAPLGTHRLFRDHRRSIDSALVLFMFAQALAVDARVVVDVGCGRGALIDPDVGERRMHDVRGEARRVIGIDVDPDGAQNPVIDEFRMIDGSRWPLEDGEADLVMCDWVLEHISDPQDFVDELHRVLRPGGAFVARTVSRRSPLSIGARLVPNKEHAKVLARMQPGRRDRDVFPTVYAMNTVPALRGLLGANFDWAVSFYPGIENYLSPWPRAAAVAAAVEPRLPRRSQIAMVVTARKH